jgi:N-acetylglucosamine kinase-like BadF-type ATPase
LRKGFLAIDQERQTNLLDAALAYWKLPTLNALIEYANGNPAPNFSELAPLVASCAAAGDPIATEVLEDGGQQLAYLASLVIERMRRREADSGAAFSLPDIAVAGSVLVQIELVREALIVSLRKAYPAIRVLERTAEPVAGALWRARAAV